MSIAIAEEHRELARIARGFLQTEGARDHSRELLAARAETLPSFWSAMAELGWLGLHVPEASGGQGFGIAELAVVVEELGYAAAPGPFLPTVIASALIVESAAADDGRPSDEVAGFLPGLVDGSRVAAIGFGSTLRRDEDGALQGFAGLAVGGEVAGLLVLTVDDDVVILDAQTPGLRSDPVINLDLSRRVTSVRCEGVSVDEGRVLKGARPALVRIARALSAAEAAGAARACTEMATEYAKVREQFGRTIGTFQAVKHHCANMLVATEQATATAWGATRSGLSRDEADLAASIAAVIALPAFMQCAETGIQVLGGIGYTWEHDAHLYLRRAAALLALVGPVDDARQDVTRSIDRGVKLSMHVELPPEAEAYRAEVSAFVASYKALPEEDRRMALCESGYLVPHWPKPFGRGAGPVEQLVIEQEFAGVKRPNLSISGWNTLTILQNGSPQQVDKYVPASLRGTIQFCQLFSEPNAGSDAAAVRTRGIKVDGGWRVTGQKVWTSGAHESTHGFATVRTNPDAAKHKGISMMVIDMKADGVTVRPLRQITGQAHFNEVFLEDVFVPDEDVVGPVDGGWTVARNNLGNERVSIGSDGGGAKGRGPNYLKLMHKYTPGDVGVAREVGDVLSVDASVKQLNLRSVVRALSGGQRGAEGNVTKLVDSELMQRGAALASRIGGVHAAGGSPKEARFGLGLLTGRGATIGGGTSEIARNQIAERLLGLPRDPLIR